MYRLVRLSIHDSRWLDFVASRGEATPFHHPSWARTIMATYRLSGFALALEDATHELCAGIPIVAKPSLARSRNAWVSLPYTDRCEPLGEPEHVHRMMTTIQETGLPRHVHGMEVRSRVPGLFAVQRGLTHTVDLTSFDGPDDLLSRLSKSRIQRALRKANAAHVVVRTSAAQADLSEVFYRLHVLTRRRQGVPVQPRRFFRRLGEEMLARGLGVTYVAEVGDVPVAAAVFLRWKGVAVYKFGASDRSRLDVRPNHAIFWRAIQDGLAAGDRVLDLGRTDMENTGLREFKSSWGAGEEALVYSSSRPAAPRHSGRASSLAASVIRTSPPWVCRMAGERLYRYAS